MNTKNLLVGIGLCLLSACTEVDNKLEVNRALEYCDRQVHRTLEVMHGKGREVDYTMMPRNIMDGQYDWNYRKVSKEECYISSVWMHPSLMPSTAAAPPCSLPPTMCTSGGAWPDLILNMITSSFVCHTTH